MRIAVTAYSILQQHLPSPQELLVIDVRVAVISAVVSGKVGGRGKIV